MHLSFSFCVEKRDCVRAITTTRHTAVSDWGSNRALNKLVTADWESVCVLRSYGVTINQK